MAKIIIKNNIKLNSTVQTNCGCNIFYQPEAVIIEVFMDNSGKACYSLMIQHESTKLSKKEMDGGAKCSILPNDCYNTKQTRDNGLLNKKTGKQNLEKVTVASFIH